MKTYAGIGSRETPTDILHLMTAIAKRLATYDYVLRSGAAPGADSAFELGAPTDKVEIYLPWKGFNGHPSKLCYPSNEALAMAEQFHPNWNACSRGARALHARNCHQILGRDLNDPVDFVVCWTRGGSGTGGTGQALRIARAHSIPIYDLGHGRHVLDQLSEQLK